MRSIPATLDCCPFTFKAIASDDLLSSSFFSGPSLEPPGLDLARAPCFPVVIWFQRSMTNDYRKRFHTFFPQGLQLPVIWISSPGLFRVVRPF
jgi:hypothetical protein